MPSMTENVRPEVLVSLAALPFAEFVARYSERSFLLVKLDDATGELETGLAALDTAHDAQPTASLNVIGFHTVIADLPTVVPSGREVDVDVAELRRRIALTRHYAITLEKREQDASYQGRISIGRARNKDIVLRHASVSKFHAWFERDAKGEYRLADAGSKNGTRINQDECSARELIQVKPGDVLRFGSVEAVLCSPETLWKVLQIG
jgi:hypothetical protein